MLKGYTISGSRTSSDVQKKQNYLTRLKGKLGLYVSIALFLVLISSLTHSFSKTREIITGVEEKRNELNILRSEEERLKTEIEKVSSEDYVERQLRDSLGMAREGEIVIILPEPETVKKFALRDTNEKTTMPDPNWKLWLKLFF